MKLAEEIEYLNTMLLKMGDVVIDNITDSINYYFGKNDIDMINDDIVDHYERLIEEICINILLKERPYARDLKEVTGVLKLVSDIERIGDHAEDIYTFARKLKDIKEPRMTRIDELFKFVLNMLKDSFRAYVNKDIVLAQKIIDSDDYVDSEYESIINELIKHEDDAKSYLPFAIYSTLIVKYLERIADHSVNIAEWVIYVENGFYKDKKII